MLLLLLLLRLLQVVEAVAVNGTRVQVRRVPTRAGRSKHVGTIGWVSTQTRSHICICCHRKTSSHGLS